MKEFCVVFLFSLQIGSYGFVRSDFCRRGKSAKTKKLEQWKKRKKRIKANKEKKENCELNLGGSPADQTETLILPLTGCRAEGVARDPSADHRGAGR